MDINTLQERIAHLEACLYDALAKELRDFKTETGFTPSNVNLIFSNTQPIGQKRPDRILTDVKVTIDIGS